MKLSSKTKHIASNVFIFLFSFIYILSIKIGFEERNIDLKKNNKATSVVEHFGIDIYYGSKGTKSNVFYIKLKDLNRKIGVYRFSKNYDDLLKLVKVGETVTIYYRDNSNETENVNIDLIQLENKTQVLIPKSEYEKKKSSLLYIGIGGIIAHAFIFYYNRKKYLRTLKK